MEGFPLFDVLPSFLEKVITKLDYKAYFRLQQTNSRVIEFIRTSKNISVHLDGKYFLGFNGAVWHLCVIKNSRPLHITVEFLHGVRFELLEARLGSTEESQYLCDRLVENNITCTKVGMYDIVGWNIEQCEKFLKSIKPIAVTMISAGTDKFEAILQSKTVKNVEAYLDSNVAEIAVSKILPSVEKLNIYVSNALKFSTVKNILKVLLSEPYPNLSSFYLQADWESRELPSKQKLEKDLQEFNTSVEEENHRNKKKVSILIEMPVYLPQIFTCKLVINNCHGNQAFIYFGRSDCLPQSF